MKDNTDKIEWYEYEKIHCLATLERANITNELEKDDVKRLRRRVIEINNLLCKLRK